MATSDQIGQPMHIAPVMPVQEPLHIKPRTTGLPYDDAAKHIAGPSEG